MRAIFAWEVKNAAYKWDFEDKGLNRQRGRERHSSGENSWFI